MIPRRTWIATQQENHRKNGIKMVSHIRKTPIFRGFLMFRASERIRLYCFLCVYACLCAFKTALKIAYFA